MQPINTNLIHRLAQILVEQIPAIPALDPLARSDRNPAWGKLQTLRAVVQAVGLVLDKEDSTGDNFLEAVEVQADAFRQAIHAAEEEVNRQAAEERQARKAQILSR